jgi:hypothetical protein
LAAAPRWDCWLARLLLLRAVAALSQVRRLAAAVALWLALLAVALVAELSQVRRLAAAVALWLALTAA